MSNYNLALIFIILLLIYACSDDDPCDIYEETLNGKFHVVNNPSEVIEISGGVEGISKLSISGNVLIECTYRIEDCTTGATVSTCNGNSESGYIKISDRDHILVISSSEELSFVRVN